MASYQFLTTKSLRRTIFKEQHEYLYILALEDMGQKNLTFDLTYNDGSANQTSKSIGNLSKGDIHLIDVGFDNIGYDLIESAKTISLIQIHIDDELNERIYLTPATLPSDNAQHLFYFNSLGGMDSLICTGSTQETQQTKFEESIREREADSGNSFSEIETHNSNGNTLFDFNSGYKTLNELEACKDMFLINKSFKLINQFGTESFLPLILTSSKIRHSPDDQNLKSISFSAKQSFIEEAKDRIL